MFKKEQLCYNFKRQSKGRIRSCGLVFTVAILVLLATAGSHNHAWHYLTLYLITYHKWKFVETRKFKFYPWTRKSSYLNVKYSRGDWTFDIKTIFKLSSYEFFLAFADQIYYWLVSSFYKFENLGIKFCL